MQCKNRCKDIITKNRCRNIITKNRCKNIVMQKNRCKQVYYKPKIGERQNNAKDITLQNVVGRKACVKY